MKIAVLVRGLPRFIEEGAHWIHNSVFTEKFKENNTVDYFCYFWDDHSEQLSDRIERSYFPRKLKIIDYKKYIEDFKKKVDDFNESSNDLNKFIPVSICNRIKTPYFWGQYLCTVLGVEFIDNIDDYDVVMITRSDTMILINESNRETKEDILHRRLEAASHNYGIFPCSSSVNVKTGHQHLGDLFFISTPLYIKKYCKNGLDNFLNLITKDKLLFYRYNINITSPFLHHEIWKYLGEYNNASNFIDVRFYERECSEIKSILLRDADIYWNGSLEDISKLYESSMLETDIMRQNREFI
jgi:hypothetical protein